MKTRVILVLMLGTAMILGGCKDKDNRSSKTGVASIMLGRYAVCNGNCNGKTSSNSVELIVTVCKTEVITALEAVITPEDPKATVSPTGPCDFTTPQTYTVTAENGTQRDYTIIVAKGKPCGE